MLQHNIIVALSLNGNKHKPEDVLRSCQPKLSVTQT